MPKSGGSDSAAGGARRARKRSEYRAGKRGAAFADRLRALMGPAGPQRLGVRTFADRVGVAPSQISAYLSGARLPDLETLWGISDATGVSLDWLLLGEGGASEPRYQDQSRLPSALEADVAAFLARRLADAERAGLLPSTRPTVSRALKRRLRPIPAAVDPAGLRIVALASNREWVIDGTAVLEDAAAREIASARTRAVAMHTAREAAAIAQDLDRLRKQLVLGEPVDPEVLHATASDAAITMRAVAASYREMAKRVRSHSTPAG